MKGQIKKKGRVKACHNLTGILAAAIVMSNMSGADFVAHAKETDVKGNVEMEKTETEAEIKTENTTVDNTESEITEFSSVESLTVKEQTERQEDSQSEDALTENIMEEVTKAVFASVYLQFDANGGNCEVSLMELTPDNVELEFPKADKEGFCFTGWYTDIECTNAFDTNKILWEPGNTLVLYAGYEEQQQDNSVLPLLVERTLRQNMNGVTITVEGNMPKEAELVVEPEELTITAQENIVQASDIFQTTQELNASYSYDISICYQNVEYEPYLFDETMQVTFSFADEQELKDTQQMEVFHIDYNENVEKIEIKEASDCEVSFDADAFSTYILITKVEYTGNKNWTYDFTGDVQTFTAPISGEYIFECYGAGTNNSKGSFAKGTVALKKDETVYIYVGGQNNTFNGGGTGGSVWHSASNSEGSFSGNVSSEHGCGATDVRIGTELEDRMIVAGGGGGDGHEGGVNYSYNGSVVSGGRFYNAVLAVNQISSNNVFGQGSSYDTRTGSGDWGSGSYPNHGTYSYRVVTGGGGGGYYGGNSGYAGTSKIIPSVEYSGKEYQVTNSVVENLVYTGNGKCEIALYSLEADVITYYNYNMENLGEAAGLTGSYVSFPQMSGVPARESDSKYDYSYCGWDDMATEEIEHYTDEQTIAAALKGDRNYIAAYESTGKSYAVILDSADAQNEGTTNIQATYDSSFPDIVIPVKEGAVFAGYYTEENGAGMQIYSAEGKGMRLSEFNKNSVIYAHWIQPIAHVKNPENKEVLAGYAGIILTTEAQMSQATGYVLSYQWYVNHQNSNTGGNPIADADSRKLVIPQGLSTGKYYFYCVITATSALNAQKVSVITQPAQLSVDKGSIGMEHIKVKNQNCVYDGTPKVLEAAINNSNAYIIYYGTEPLNAENYSAKGTTVPNSYINAGNYINYIYVTGADFVDFSGSITMTIEKAEPRVYLSSKNAAYNGRNQTVDAAHVYGTDGKKIEAAITYVYFTDEVCRKKTNSGSGAVKEGGAPKAVGTYYVLAATSETANYKAAATKTPAMFNILRTNIKYSISGFRGIYDGKPHGLCIANEDKSNTAIYFSDMKELTKENYQTEGTVIPYEYTAVGTYQIYYIAVTRLAGGIDQYITGIAEIVIEEGKQNNGNNNSGNHGNSNDSSNGGSSSNISNNQEGNQTDDYTGNNEGVVEPNVYDYELISFHTPLTAKKDKIKETVVKVKKQEELERLLSILRTQSMIKQEQASLCENMLPAVKEAESQETTEQPKTVWELLWAFFLGAAVMHLTHQMVGVKNPNREKKDSQERFLIPPKMF